VDRALVNSEMHAMFHEVRESERFQTAKVTFKVIQGYWQWCHTIGHIRFPISDSLQSLSCTVNEILPLTSQNLKTSRDASYIPFGGNIMHALAALLSINQQTKFEVPIFLTIFKDMTGEKF